MKKPLKEIKESTGIVFKNLSVVFPFIFSFLLMFIAQTSSQAAVVKGEVVSVHGDIVKLNIGSDKGIKENDAGRVFYTITIDGKEKFIYVAKFKITHTSRNSSMAQIEEKTGEVRVGHLAEITLKHGLLVVRTEPSEANVYIDGKLVGVSPYENKATTPGNYLVRVSKEDYEIEEKSVSVEAGRTAEVFAQLKRKGPKLGESWRDPTTGMEFVFVKGGCFEMGCGSWTSECLDSEKPVHEVCVNNLWIGKYEVTLGQFRKFVNETGYQTEAEKGDGCFCWTGSKWEKDSTKNWRNPGFSQNESHPVVCVSHNDSAEYIRWMSMRSNKRYRLPTEAEWEYAARSGGGREKFAGFSDVNELSQYANFCDRNCKLPHKLESQNDGYEFTAPVGSLRPNGLGLYDMSGNVWEWCQDWYDKDYYRNSPRNNPGGPSAGQLKVLRGGSWSGNPWGVRASARDGVGPSGRDSGIGFRLVLSSE